MSYWNSSSNKLNHSQTKMTKKQFLEILSGIYGDDKSELSKQLIRYEKLVKLYKAKFKKNEYNLFRTPGRTEISGNHTDHNFGKVLAASVNLDSIAAASRNNKDLIRIFSEGYKNIFEVKIDNLSVIKSEQSTTNSLIRGMAAQFKNLGYSIGGFDAVISSDVLPGSGLSSSASIEVLIGTILNHFYNEGKISKVQISQISQYAENVYFGKPCGLMDQLSCALGGVIQIDFKDLGKPKIKKMDVNFQSFGYDLIIVNTGGDHIDLTDEYASIPNDMKLVAKKFGKPSLRKVNEKIFFKNIPKLSLALGDRAVLRAYHYFIENKRIDSQVIALENSDFDLFLKLFNESGNSSFRWLQNVYTHKNVKKQPISLAIALTEEFFNNNSCKGGVRIHGGGFAGTILTIIPKEFSKYYIKYMEPIFGKGNIVELRITNIGTCIIL